MRSIAGSKLKVAGAVALVAALWVAGCGGASAGGACSAELPATFGCQRELSLEQSQCSGNTAGRPLTASVQWSTDRKALQVDAATFRCEQRVCAYLGGSEAEAQVLLQPCDMHPETVTRCTCGYSFSVPIELRSTATRVSVQVRNDSLGGAQPPSTIGSLPVGPSAALCDGSSVLRFAATSGGGNLSGIPGLISELGWSFLLVDGQCHYYAMTAPDREVRMGTLSDTDAPSLARDFELGAWQGLDHPASGCPDANAQVFAFGVDRVRSSCETTPLTMATDRWLKRLYDAGRPVTGAVRYSVIEPSNEQWPSSSPASALTYPLADPTSIATEPNGRGKPQIASGMDADALRGVRTAYQKSTPPVPAPAYSVPVVVTAGGEASRYFDLAMRDTVPFEVNGVLTIDAFLE